MANQADKLTRPVKAKRQEKIPVIINAEGLNKTEFLYFKGLSRDKEYRDRIRLQFASGTKTDPEGMVRELADSIRDKGFSKIENAVAYCFIDTDCNKDKDPQIGSAERVAKKHSIDLIVSSPSFEVWFLCHYLQTIPNHTNQNDVIKALLKTLPDYKKSDEAMFETLRPNLPSAIETAKRLEKQCKGRGYKIHTAEFSPSTEVFKVIETLMK